MKGKKFTAAEKHFQKKEEQYLKRIKALEAENEKLTKRSTVLAEENSVLQKQNETLVQSNTKLLELCKLSESDLAILVKKEKDVAEAASGMLALMRHNGIY